MRRLECRRYVASLLFAVSIIVVLLCIYFNSFRVFQLKEPISILDPSGSELDIHEELVVEDERELKNSVTEIAFFLVRNNARDCVIIESVQFLPVTDGISVSTYRVSVPPGEDCMPKVIVRYSKFGKYTFNTVRLCYRLNEERKCVEVPANITIYVRKKVKLCKVGEGNYLKLYLDFANSSLLPRDKSLKYIRVCKGFVI